MSEHTPGPWLRIDTADYAEIHAAFRPSLQAVALVGKPEDADLIAVAPDLYDALAAVFADHDNVNRLSWTNKAAAALAKAAGHD